MGIFLPQGYGWTLVNVDIDGAALVQLRCGKTPEQFFQHLVERCDGIAGVVFDLGSQANGSTVRQMNARFSDSGDVSNARGGLTLDWADCSTKFLDLTPRITTGAPVPTVYLRLMVGFLGSFGGTSTPCAASLLV